MLPLSREGRFTTLSGRITRHVASMTSAAKPRDVDSSNCRTHRSVDTSNANCGRWVSSPRSQARLQRSANLKYIDRVRFRPAHWARRAQSRLCPTCRPVAAGSERTYVAPAVRRYGGGREGESALSIFATWPSTPM